ncbi:MAG: NAD-dependent epimerase/dehydratase family protein [Actinomycetes bacterium]
MRILLAGALGEVGSTVSAALRDRGHEVIGVSSRAPLVEFPQIVEISAGLALLRSGGVDGVIHCGGRGDRRDSDRSGLELTEALRDAAVECGVPAVLISTTRVLEGHSGRLTDDMAPLTTTPYARANAENEETWLATRDPRLRVLRITNYFAQPSGPNSPQAALLPWSLVTEALAAGTITMRSGPSLTKEFVGALGVAQGAVELLRAPHAPLTCATTPGLSLSLRELAEYCAAALSGAGHDAPTVTFGPDTPSGPGSEPGFLASIGWTCELTPEQIELAIAEWIRQHYSA